MPGDELHEEAADAVAKAVADARRPRTGPRHAAPRKPLLTRLHMPAGKAIAMAAMPSAVLMGMGLSPQLAAAKSLPKGPFKDRQCVSAPDKDDEAEQDRAQAEALERAQEEAREKARAQAARKAAAERQAAEEKAEVEAKAEAERKAAEAREKAEEEAEAAERAAEAAKEEARDAAPEPSESSGSLDVPGISEPSPSTPESGSGGLLGGLGDTVRDVLSPEEKEEREQRESSAPAPSDSGSPADGTASDAVDDTVGRVQKDLDDTADALEKDGEDATGTSPEPSPSGKSGEAGESGEAEQDAADGRDAGSYPCVEEKKTEGEDERTPVPLPNDAWHLEASSLDLHGLDYEGVFNVRTADGTRKQVLKFTAASADIVDLHQIVDGPEGIRYHVRSAEGSTSTISGGRVTMYTERLEGNLFGLVPVVFDPEHPPPLNLPEVRFTDVKVRQAGQFGGNLTVTGLDSTIERS